MVSATPSPTVIGIAGDVGVRGESISLDFKSHLKSPRVLSTNYYKRLNDRKPASQPARQPASKPAKQASQQASQPAQPASYASQPVTNSKTRKRAAQ
jgi:hypothetical protein